MEEKVGSWWDSLIRRAAYRGHPQAAVRLQDVEKTAPLFFRALGGDPALGLRSTVGTEHGGRRTLLERIAGTGNAVELAWSDDQSLFLPQLIDLFADPALNQQLYYWLLALSAQIPHHSPRLPWLQRNQQASAACLAAMPGLAATYQRLVAAYLPLRGRVQAPQQPVEDAIAAALREPAVPLDTAIASLQGIMPVHLWLHPTPPTVPRREAAQGEAPDDSPDEHGTQAHNRRRNYRARQVEPEEGKHGPLIIFRAESIFTWDNYVKVNRHDDDDELGDVRAAEDMQELAVARDTKKRASRLKFNLDLPSPDYDDTPLGPGLKLPEWNHKTQQLVPAHCHLQPMLPKDASPCALPEHLQPAARRLRRQFQALAPQRTRRFGQTEGLDLDLDRVVRFFTDLRAGQAHGDAALYQALPPGARSLACLVLADVSLSTEAWVGQGGRSSTQGGTVIQVIRDSLMLLGEALQATGDAFAMAGFSSLKRSHVRYLLLKDFGQPYDDAARGRIAALRPGYYTRMGAAIRQSALMLREQPAHQRLLLLVTDGKPNDLDHYEGRWGVEDTRHAVLEARQQGLTPFCVTIDKEAGDYLPHLFGHHNYVVVPDATRLPQVLTRLYAALAR